MALHADDVISLYRLLEAESVRVWLTGGWGIDALLGEQTRPHKDLDIIMLVDDVVRMRELLGRHGYELKELWEENLPAVDIAGSEVATAFVLRDATGREIDAHAMRLDAAGNGIPAWDAEGVVIREQALAGNGTIAGLPVRCVSPEMQVVCHQGYPLPAAQERDLAYLKARFDIGDR